MDTISHSSIIGDDIPSEDCISELILDLDQVNWNSNYILSKASLGQIMVSFRNILKVNPKNLYETTLYGNLKPAIKSLLDVYCNILNCKNLKEYNVKYYNLIGNMPSSVSELHDEHGCIRMKNAKISALIKASKQRTDFIIQRETPLMYLDDSEYLIEFTNMKMQLANIFVKQLLEFETDFIFAIDEAHKAQKK